MEYKDTRSAWKTFDIIVVGAGHAGCEAALAAARLKKKTILFATNLDTVAFLACNPSIGGTAKGQIVKEIDALGGQMALNTDKSILQMRMLNRGKGPAVHSPRAQVDKHWYHINMKDTIEKQENLTLRQGEVVSIEPVETGFLVTSAVGQKFFGKAVIVCCGVYLNSRTVVGMHAEDSGPNGFQNAKHLSESLTKLGFALKRFKTGTPARVKLSSLNFQQMSEQKGDNTLSPFSFMSEAIDGAKRSCYLTYTTDTTKRLILENKHLAPIYNGGIEGTGPRYCPSIEDKVVRFSDKERHQIFLEPEGEFTNEFYVQGASSSMPAEIQEKIYRSIDGLSDVEILRDAYAIEYDCIDATELNAALMSKKQKGLFFAGQINGTSGYEEAACQGLVAGINAVRFLNKEQPFILTRNDSYIGVLIDDITTKETSEPYRMMTGRAEHRLVLRQDNADLRLTEAGRQIGLVDDLRYEKFCLKVSEIKRAEREIQKVLSPKDLGRLFESTGDRLPGNGLSVSDLFRRNFSGKQIQERLGLMKDFSDGVLEEIEIIVRYEGYIEKQQALIDNAKRLEERTLPEDIDYGTIDGLRLEARQKLNKIRPLNLGQASRILGVSPADIQILIVFLMQRKDGHK